MKIPALLDRRTLSKMASPDETHCVRVILQKVSNPAPYTVRGRIRRYLFERNQQLCSHILDVPVSIWMAEVPNNGPHRQNPSVSDDLKPTMQLPFTIQVIPWGNATPATTATAPDVFPLVRQVAQKLEAPAIMRKAIDLAAAGDVDGLRALLAGGPDKQPEPPTESPAAARMRKMREAKAAKKAQLQPA